MVIFDEFMTVFCSVHQEFSKNKKPPIHQGGGFQSSGGDLFGEFSHHTGAARCLTCSASLRVRRLTLGAPKFLFHVIALIKLPLRLRSQVRIGVRAAGNKIQRAKGRGSVPKPNFNLRLTNLMT